MPLRPLAACLIAWLFFAAPLGASQSDARLVEAAKRANEAAVGSLLERGSDANAASADGATALHWAAHLDEPGMAERLVRAGANGNASNRYGVTPLMLGSTNGNAAILELLLEAGADPNTAMPGGEPPLRRARHSKFSKIFRFV